MQTPKTHAKPNKTAIVLPVFGSTLLHAGVFVAVAVFGAVRALPEPSVTQTQLASGAEFNDIKSALAAHIAKNTIAEKQTASTHQKPSASTTQPAAFHDFPRTAQYDTQFDDLANWESTWSSDWDAPAISDDEFAERFAANAEKQAQINALLDDKPRPNPADNTDNNTNTKDSSKTTQNANADGAPATPKVQKIVSKAEREQAGKSAAGRIFTRWEQTQSHAQAGKSLKATISLDAAGNVLQIRFGAGDKELQPFIEQAIRQSSPLHELAGMMESLTIEFNTTPPRD
ncbi:hypothetical protein B0181_05435 [Moraxella caviae]|uniref:Protein TolA n=1 Tax=Moraxella caviae TaxID=34060 RepID=A0A1T0A3B8_9GAMM|nr:hypothetical protein [Moraxella caviae]OOR90088.1 hypothetical protein B0181_05435 [Moraxella caviae]STZ14706.1 Uncharacterised protein [Moraxella caviae]VEW11423.1 Uncharacterised protein [Moraxella caviae]VEW12866.1 Uncharacterised protein [Moraxella caviae]